MNASNLDVYFMDVGRRPLLTRALATVLSARARSALGARPARLRAFDGAWALQNPWKTLSVRAGRIFEGSNNPCWLHCTQVGH